MSSIKKLAIRGAVWTIASYGTSQILRFGSNLILTRLFIPDVFGLMALVYVFISGLHLFSDIGIGTSIIQNKRGDDPVFLNTAWTMQVIRGVGLWICSFLIAWPVAAFYAKPNQEPIFLFDPTCVDPSVSFRTT
jgi:O-antigen/teichoic acid export membrane protein